MFSRICKLLVAGFCAFLLMGNTPFAPSSIALAVGLPSGEYDIPLLPADDKEPYSPYVGQYQDSHPRQVFWGDTHLHTVYSFDAGAAGTLLDPEASYRFARGEEVTTDAGQPVQLSRPLDFLVVTDHTDQLGSFLQFVETPPQDCDTQAEQDLVDEWHGLVTSGNPEDAAQAQVEIVKAFAQGTIPSCMLQSPEQYRTAWTKEVDWAEEFNDSPKFTAVIGYEWTSLNKGNNLHRNVIFRDGACEAKQLLPKTTLDGTDPELLWNWMDTYEQLTGGSVLAIPHNGNLSNGEMFADLDASGNPLTTEYAQKRQRWEPLYEVIQIKGASETHEDISPDDEFAGFETDGWDNGNLDLTYPETPDMYEHEYARGALKNGLKFEKDLDVNPFKFGLVGSTDSHIALPAVEENSFMGKFPSYSPSASRAAHVSKKSSFNKTRILNFIDENVPDETQEKIKAKIGEIAPDDIDPDAIKQKIRDELIARGFTVDSIPPIVKDNLVPETERLGWQYGAAGFVGVWAEENTRESLFDAMARREVYATSGPRMVARLFGGWDFTEDDLELDPGEIGYAKGVPMGSDLTVAPDGQSPTFLVAAMKDPLRANLDRIQIVKGWLDANGDTQEQVYNVAWSDDRVLGSDGKLPLVGSLVNPGVTDPANDTGTVDTDNATWTDTIGAIELNTVWTDPDFDPTQKAFYYARVLEIPTPRWTDYDKAFYGGDWCGEAIAENGPEACDDIPLTLQERVYTSPIWYSPA